MEGINKRNLLQWSWRRGRQRMVVASRWRRHWWSRPICMATLRGWVASLQRRTQQGRALPAKNRDKNYPSNKKRGEKVINRECLECFKHCATNEQAHKNRGTGIGISPEKGFLWSDMEKRLSFSKAKSNIFMECSQLYIANWLFLLWYWTWKSSPPLAWVVLSPLLFPLLGWPRSLVRTQTWSNCSCCHSARHQLPPYPWPPERSEAWTEP